LQANKILFKSAIADETVLRAGTHCKYCPAAGYCGERMRHTMSLVGLTESVNKLSNEQVMAILDEASTIRATLEAVQAEAVSRARSGYPVKNWKLVKSKVNAKCTDEAGFLEEAEAAGVDVTKITKVKLMGATACKKVVDVQLVNQYFVKPEAGQQLVKLTDKRAAIAPDASGVFEPVEPIKVVK
jgi:hypothetical protein